MAPRKVFLINSFDSAHYVRSATELAASLRASAQRDDEIIIAFGGVKAVRPGGVIQHACNAPIVRYTSTSSKKTRPFCTHILCIHENLSDNNAFVAFQRACDEGGFDQPEHQAATYVYLHDTCLLGETFAQRMSEIRTTPKTWVFAHTYGLYNMGIAPRDFLISRGVDFRGVSAIPKHMSIQLEQGTPIAPDGVPDGVTICPLSAYSTLTLTHLTLHSHQDGNVLPVTRADYMSLNACTPGRSASRRFVSFIGAFGVYKLVGATCTYFLPIWATPSHEVRSYEERCNMLRQFDRVGLVAASGATMGTVASWVPFVPYDFANPPPPTAPAPLAPPAPPPTPFFQIP